ncbi:metal-dependent transcriptional regulator [Demequina zhanjiangensis]|uniref:Metal-dependent transcriptional regulator n=1 Tax=Demequina zhanjiangensis TaxID=3051659 RepID=A0ABT8FYG1_9MICO|nr:metal-dependent transcriptional regulator [Demequina sp. SYSU T00b26]MDN4471944.1 metal-dependent transcriptional regulator [Demequina sp. SYSU T00b26]
MSDLIDTTEMYLRTIYELVEDGVVPMRARIVEQLGHSGPTVSQTVARMERDGLVVVSDDRHLELTPEGEQIAMRVMRKHRLAERLLTDVLGLDLAHAHDEACRWEHVMSERVEKRVLALVEDARMSPYGNPVPGLEELGVSGADTPGGISLLDAAAQNVSRVTVIRIGENPQAHPDVLEPMLEAGVIAGASLGVRREGEDVVLVGEAGEVHLSNVVARHVFVTIS